MLAPHRRSRAAVSGLLPRIRLWHFAAALIITAAAGLTWLQLLASESTPYTTQHVPYSLDDAATDEYKSSVDDVLVQQLVQACMQQQDTFIWLIQAKGQQQLAVADDHKLHRNPGLADGQCGLVYIPLDSSDRSIGLCTDAALYILLLGAWITPATDFGLQHAQKCNSRSSVMFLEPLYDPWLSWLDRQQHIVAAYAPNFEQLHAYDQAAHKRMQLILCKVRRCEDLMRMYLEDIHSTASVIYTGHTSVDPFVIQHKQQLPSSFPGAATLSRLLSLAPSQQHQQQQSQQQQQRHHQHQQQRQQGMTSQQSGPQPQSDTSAIPDTVAAAVQPLAFLHVRGKSGLKHTKQLLDCWIQHPEWPPLTVIGPMPNEQITGAEARRYMAAPNIHAPNPGKAQGPNWPEFEPLTAGQLSALLLSHAVHIMPSEREGFGHSINEGRAAGAVLLVPDHPPMHELVRDGSGILLVPHHTFSHVDAPVPALGKYGNISASMSPEGICAGVQQVLAKSPHELVVMGRRARAQFEADRAEFVQRIGVVLQELRAQLGVA